MQEEESSLLEQECNLKLKREPLRKALVDASPSSEEGTAITMQNILAMQNNATDIQLVSIQFHRVRIQLNQAHPARVSLQKSQ